MVSSHQRSSTFALWKSGFVFGASGWASGSPALLLSLETALSHPSGAPGRKQRGNGDERRCLKGSAAQDVPQALLRSLWWAGSVC